MKKNLVVFTVFILLATYINCNGSNKKDLVVNDSDTGESKENREITNFALIRSEEIGEDEEGVVIVKNYYEGAEHFLEVTVIENISLEGEIVVTGDATYNELVLVTKENGYYVFKPEFIKQYWTRQGEKLIITGKVEKRILTNKETGKVLTKYWFYPETIT